MKELIRYGIWGTVGLKSKWKNTLTIIIFRNFAKIYLKDRKSHSSVVLDHSLGHPSYVYLAKPEQMGYISLSKKS